METEKMIEEMAKCYCDYCMAQTGEKECENQADKSCSVFWDCEFFYNAGYRKIPKGAVVLTREDYNRIRSKERQVIDLESIMKAEEQSRKETAERDFNTIIKALETKKASIMTHYGVKESVGADIAIRTVKELAKQCGVEVE